MHSMKKLLFSVFLLFLVLGSTLVSADYQPENDIVIDLESDLINLSPNQAEKIKNFSVNTQDAIHDAVYKTTGYNYNYSYIWINLNGQTVVGIDPPSPSY